MLGKLMANGLRRESPVEAPRSGQTDKSELLELAVAMLEAPPESTETQDVLRRLDAGDIPFANAIERLRGATQLTATARRRS